MPELINSRAMSIIVHGDSKAGKSTLITTAPRPILLLDAEAAHRFMNLRKIEWNPMTQAPPVYDGTWDMAVVVVRDYSTMVRSYEWLNSGQHPFRSLGVDSITEIQVKLKEQVAGDPVAAKMNYDKWGAVLAHMEDMMRKMRDLTAHPTHPLEAVIITAMTHMMDGKWRPFMQGQSAKKAPYFYDIIGYMYVELQYNAQDPTQPPVELRRMLAGFDPTIIAGERVQGRLPRIIDNPNVTTMLDTVFGHQQPPPSTNQGGNQG